MERNRTERNELGTKSLKLEKKKECSEAERNGMERNEGFF